MSDILEARVAPRPPSPLLVAVRQFLSGSLSCRAYTTHYQLGGMRCKLYGVAETQLPKGLRAYLIRAGFKNISILGGQIAGFRHPSVTILASLGDTYVAPSSPVKRVAKKASSPGGIQIDEILAISDATKFGTLVIGNRRVPVVVSFPAKADPDGWARVFFSRSNGSGYTTDRPK